MQWVVFHMQFHWSSISFYFLARLFSFLVPRVRQLLHSKGWFLVSTPAKDNHEVIFFRRPVTQNKIPYIDRARYDDRVDSIRFNWTGKNIRTRISLYRVYYIQWNNKEITIQACKDYTFNILPVDATSNCRSTESCSYIQHSGNFPDSYFTLAEISVFLFSIDPEIVTVDLANGRT